MTFDTISEENLTVLVHTFYDRVHHHDTLGPTFNAILKGRWDMHLSRMVDFWSSVLLASGRYYGQPLHAHMMVQGLTPEHFSAWLELWRNTLDDLYTPDLADKIYTAAARMGSRMQYALFERPVAEGWISADTGELRVKSA
jgi:hemoglobin